MPHSLELMACWLTIINHRPAVPVGRMSNPPLSPLTIPSRLNPRTKARYQSVAVTEQQTFPVQTYVLHVLGAERRCLIYEWHWQMLTSSFNPFTAAAIVVSQCLTQSDNAIFQWNDKYFFDCFAYLLSYNYHIIPCVLYAVQNCARLTICCLVHWPVDDWLAIHVKYR